MRLVFDTNILISATGWEGSVSEKLTLKMVESGFKIFTSQEILSEFHKVLVRDFHYNSKQATEKIEGIKPLFIIVEPTNRVIAIAADPNDNKIIECALTCSADYIISYDKHLLDIKLGSTTGHWFCWFNRPVVFL